MEVPAWLRGISGGVKSDDPIGYFPYSFGGGGKFVLGSRREELRYRIHRYLLSLANETLPVGTVIWIIILLGA